MNETQEKVSHTPGPWEFDPRNFGRPWNPGWGLLDSYGGSLGVSVSEPVLGKSEDEVFANARLIAAAPSLLAAAKEWVAYFDKLDRDAEPGDPLAEARRKFHAGRVERTRAAIALAESGK